MATTLTALTSTGSLQLGNLLGAIRPMVAAQDRPGSTVILADLHAMTVEHDPARLAATTLDNGALLLAAGIDPERTTLYVQSDLPEHLQLHYLLECTTGYGEARRMIQFKEKSAGRQRVRLSLLTYPVLMAADILLHDTREVPVGADQAQHLELTRTVAARFNGRYGDTFVLPRTINPPVAARIMSLTDPVVKMSKTRASGTIFLLDPPDVVRRKVMRAVTDAAGVANLHQLLAACSPGKTQTFNGYAELKAAVVDAVLDVLRPIQDRYGRLRTDDGYLRRVLNDGARRARPRARATVDRARTAIGLDATAHRGRSG